jgi:hypothetical protein
MPGRPMNPLSQLCTQVSPTWIRRLNQRDFLRAQPALDLLFPRDGAASSAMLFEPDELLNVVPLRESLNLPLLVLPNAADQIAGDTDVQHLGFAGENVHAKNLRHELIRELDASRCFGMRAGVKQGKRRQNKAKEERFFTPWRRVPRNGTREKCRPPLLSE